MTLSNGERVKRSELKRATHCLCGNPKAQGVTICSACLASAPASVREHLKPIYNRSRDHAGADLVEHSFQRRNK